MTDYLEIGKSMEYTDHPPNPAQRRHEALRRDEYRLREAAAEHEARGFDVETAKIVRARTEDLVETLELLAMDEEFWNALHAGNPISTEWAAELQRIDPIVFALHLEASGYRFPPRPRAQDLVDETLAELAAALRRNPAGEPVKPNITLARRGVSLSIRRIRRDIEFEGEPRGANLSMLHVAARRVGRIARWLLPKTLAVATGVLVEAHAPGSGAGLLAGKAGAKLAEAAVESGSTLLLERLATSAEDDEPSEVDDMVRPVHVLRHHITGLADAIASARDSYLYEHMPYQAPGSEPGRVHIDKAFRHIHRLYELLNDQDISPDGSLDHNLKRIYGWLRETGSPPPTCDERDVALASLQNCLDHLDCIDLRCIDEPEKGPFGSRSSASGR